MGSFSIWHWLVVLVIVILIFGTKKLKTLGSDLGESIRNFKRGMKDDEEKPAGAATPSPTPPAEPKLLPAQPQQAAAPARRRSKSAAKKKASAKPKAKRAADRSRSST